MRRSDLSDDGEQVLIGRPVVDAVQQVNVPQGQSVHFLLLGRLVAVLDKNACLDLELDGIDLGGRGVVVSAAVPGLIGFFLG